MTDIRTVSSSEFQTRAGQYLERGSTVVVTRYNRPLKVVIDYAEFEHLKELATHRPTREAMRVEDLPEDAVEALRAADFSHIDPGLNKLME
ncbi:MAG: type II toxin-antitoxin system prevent-host-death family antitoxin [Pseudomonadota bacterium]